MKVCTKCGVEKAYSEFGTRKNLLDGLSKQCKDCVRKYDREYYSKNREACMARSRKWQNANKDKLWHVAYADKAKIRRAIYKAGNKERISESGKAYRLNNAEKERIRHKEYAVNNRGKRAANEDRRRNSMRIATPMWANLFFIEEAYSLAKLRTEITGHKWHVDHIVPLQSEIVCGLHVHDNIRVVLGKVNMQKYNRVWPDMP